MGVKTTYTKIAERIVARDMLRVLDVGCGEGKLGLALRRLKYQGEYFGIDCDQIAVDRLREHGLEGERSDVRWWDVKPNTQYCIVAKDVPLDNGLLVHTIRLARCYFITSFTPPQQAYAAEVVCVAEKHGFIPLWDESDVVSTHPLLLFERTSHR